MTLPSMLYHSPKFRTRTSAPQSRRWQLWRPILRRVMCSASVRGMQHSITVLTRTSPSSSHCTPYPSCSSTLSPTKLIELRFVLSGPGIIVSAQAHPSEEELAVRIQEAFCSTPMSLEEPHTRDFARLKFFLSKNHAGALATPSSTTRLQVFRR